MPRRYLRNPLLVFKNPYLVGLFLVGVATYVMTFWLTPEQLLNVLSTPMAVLAAWGVWKWGGGTLQAIVEGDVSKEALGIMGVFLIMCHISLSRGNTVGVITFGWPSYSESYTAAFIVLLALVGVALFAFASRSEDPLSPKSPRTASFVTGFFSAALLIFSGAFHSVGVHFGKFWRIILGWF